MSSKTASAAARPVHALADVRLGATPEEGGTTFAVWAPHAAHVGVRLFASDTAARETLPLEPIGEGGTFASTIRGIGPGALYKLVIDDREIPDPYARFLPFGVHGPARVEPVRRVAPLSPGLARDRCVIYEMHVGTFTGEGTFRAAIEKLSHVASLGVTAIELMPISSFPGARGWGYDGVAHFAPFAGYGEPDDVRRFVEAAHAQGLGVLLDVVYNHFGPSGNYLGACAPEYFTDKHKTVWGDAPDFAEEHLRRYALDNARYWLDEFGFDGLRLDATHAIFDDGTPHVLRELSDLAHGLEPRRLIFAEDERNDPTLVTRHGLDGIWADDFHHQVRVALTGERDGYYAAYERDVAALARTIERGWLYQGETYCVTNEPRGQSAAQLDAPSFVYCVQNHDQVGNRAMGTRLHHEVPLDASSAATMLLLFLPMTPLLFMGQEWGASAPFLFFTDHEPELGAQVTRGRREEFKRFEAFRDPAATARIPDPQAQATFARSKLHWDEREFPAHARVLALVRSMLALRRDDPVLSMTDRRALTCAASGDLLRVTRTGGGDARTFVMSFGSAPASFAPPDGAKVLLTSTSDAWDGSAIAPHGAVIFAHAAAG